MLNSNIIHLLFTCIANQSEAESFENVASIKFYCTRMISRSLGVNGILVYDRIHQYNKKQINSAVKTDNIIESLEYFLRIAE